MMRFSFLLFLPLCAVCAPTPTVYFSKNQREFSHARPRNPSERFRIFCVNGMQKRFFFLFHSSYLNLSTVPPDLAVYEGANETEVESHFVSAQSSLLSYWWGVAPWKKGTIPLAPFSPHCVGIHSKHDYSLRLGYKIDLWRVLFFFAGIFLFWHAVKLSRHDALYYSSGIGISLVASLLLLVFILHRFLPFRRGLYALMVLSSATTLALLDFASRNFEWMVKEYHNFAVLYILLVSAASFSVLYLMRPRISDRSLNLVQFALQGIGLSAIFFSSQIPELSCAVIVILLLLYNFPSLVVQRVRSVWYRAFPKRRKFMTEEEYNTTVRLATEKALNDLRDFCKGPECRSWLLVSRLQSPSRFASFVEGASHVMEDEERAFSMWEDGQTPDMQGSDDESIDAVN